METTLSLSMGPAHPSAQSTMALGTGQTSQRHLHASLA